jgi:hypothetical protein
VPVTVEKILKKFKTQDAQVCDGLFDSNAFCMAIFTKNE